LFWAKKLIFYSKYLKNTQNTIIILSMASKKNSKNELNNKKNILMVRFASSGKENKNKHLCETSLMK
jgi:hypothetical protein